MSFGGGCGGLIGGGANFMVIQLYHEVFGKARTYVLKRNRLSVAKMI
jgi:hypothetical protein